MVWSLWIDSLPLVLMLRLTLNSIKSINQSRWENASGREPSRETTRFLVPLDRSSPHGGADTVLQRYFGKGAE